MSDIMYHTQTGVISVTDRLPVIKLGGKNNNWISKFKKKIPNFNRTLCRQYVTQFVNFNNDNLNIIIIQQTYPTVTILQGAIKY